MDTKTFPSTVLRRALLGLGMAAVIAVGALAATSGSAAEVLADGELHEVRVSKDATVADALDAADIELAAADDVQPAVDTEVDRGLRIVVTRAITVDVVVDGNEPVTVTAPVASVDGAVRLAGLDGLRDEGAVATPTWHDPVEDGDVITIQRPVEVVLEVDGDELTVVTLAAQVEHLLQLHEVDLGPDDLITPAVWAPLRADQTITIQRVEYVEDTEEVVLEHDEVRRNTSSLDRGRTRVDEDGRDGLRVDTYEVTLVDGEETERELLDSEVVTEPRDRVVLVGTRVPPPAPRQNLHRRHLRLGPARTVRVQRQLAGQHRQRLLRGPAVPPRYLAQRRWLRSAAPGLQGRADPPRPDPAAALGVGPVAGLQPPPGPAVTLRS